MARPPCPPQTPLRGRTCILFWVSDTPRMSVDLSLDALRWLNRRASLASDEKAHFSFPAWSNLCAAPDSAPGGRFSIGPLTSSPRPPPGWSTKTVPAPELRDWSAGIPRWFPREYVATPKKTKSKQEIPFLEMFIFILCGFLFFCSDCLGCPGNIRGLSKSAELLLRGMLHYSPKNGQRPAYPSTSPNPPPPYRPWKVSTQRSVTLFARNKTKQTKQRHWLEASSAGGPALRAAKSHREVE